MQQGTANVSCVVFHSWALGLVLLNHHEASDSTPSCSLHRQAQDVRCMNVEQNVILDNPSELGVKEI